MRAPSVSVVTPVFNAGVFLRPAVESVLSQKFPDFELLLFDDGSTDGSRDYLTSLTDTRARVTLNAKNLGVAGTRNLALAEARGEFIAFLNHDDVAAPARFAAQLAFLRARSDVSLLGTAIETLDGDGQPLPATYLPPDDTGIRWQGLIECPLRQSTLMVRRKFLQYHALTYNPGFRAHSDYDFVMRALQHGRAANLPEVLVQYRRHANSLSATARPELIAEGNRISLAAIRHELPDFAIKPEEVAKIRAVVLGYVAEGGRRSLADTKLAWQLYLDLFESFRKKHGVPISHLAPRQPAP